MVRKIDKVKARLRAVKLLQNVKQHKTYKEISQETGIPIPSLSRYIKGHVIPSYDRAKNLLQLLQEEYDLKNELRRRLDLREQYFDIYPALFDTTLLQEIAQYVQETFRDQRIEKVVSTAIDGIPLAVSVARVLEVPYAYSKRSKEVGVEEFYEETYHGSAGVLKTIYLPKPYLDKKDCVLLVDDIIRTGITMEALYALVSKSGAKVIGIFSIISFEKALNHLRPKDFPITTVLNISPSEN